MSRDRSRGRHRAKRNRRRAWLTVIGSLFLAMPLTAVATGHFSEPDPVSPNTAAPAMPWEEFPPTMISSASPEPTPTEPTPTPTLVTPEPTPEPTETPESAAPEPPPPPPEDCPSTGYGAEDGLTPDALRVLRCIAEAFPSITEFGGVAERSNPNSDHPSGRAVDAMIPYWDTLDGNAYGWRVAKWVFENQDCLGVSYIIWDAKIWSRERSGEGWRTYSIGEDPTTMHLDHVHVSVEGDSGWTCGG
jgi:hypothetical protein